MIPIELFIFLAAIDMIVVFGILSSMKTANRIYVNVYGSFLSVVLSYLLAQASIDGSTVIYGVSPLSAVMVKEAVISLSMHYVFLGMSVLMTLLFFILVIMYFKSTVEESMG